MNQYSSPEQINVRIDGNISGQVAIGNNILQIGNINGGIVNIIAPEKKPNFIKRSQPVYLRPRAFPGLLDREAEQKTAIGALRSSESLSISGANGIGKTSLLRYLAYNSPGDNFPDGIIYISTHGYTVDDLLQNIFEAFYESDSKSKPTNLQLQRFLQELKALILLDDPALEFADITKLINSAPQCTFTLASPERCLWGEGHCIELEGLPEKEAFLLLERELGRTLNPQETPSAEKFYQIAKGHPLYLIQGAALVHHGSTFTEVADKFHESEDEFFKNILLKLNETQQQILSLLAASGDAPFPALHLKSMCQRKDMDDAIKNLLSLRLIQTHSPAYSLTGSLATSIGRTTNLKEWEDRIRNYFMQWIRQNPPLPDITDALHLLLSILEKNNREKRWNDVITLGRVVEKALIFEKRWSAWARVLELILNAARSLGNRSVQGWALHQLGTRDLCMGNIDPARQTLTQALKIREALGDKAGTAITRHNLNLIIAPPAPPCDTPRSGPKSAPKGGASPTLKIFFTLLTVTAIAAVVIFIWNNPPIPPAPVNPVPIATTKSIIQPSVVINSSTRTPTKTPIKTPIKTATKTPTRTPTSTITPSPTLPPCRYGVWLCEDFNDGKAQFWSLDGYWVIRDNVLNGSEHYFATLNEYNWDDHRVTFDLNINAGTIHLNYRSSPGQNGINRYFIGVDQNGINLNRQNNEVFTSLIYKEFYYPPNQWHRMEIAGWGGHLRIYVDGQMQIEYVDHDYIRSGTISFETLDHSSAQIDNIEVLPAGDEPPVESLSQPPGIIYPDMLSVSCYAKSMTWEDNSDRPGMDYWDGRYIKGIDDTFIDASKCQQLCLDDTACKAFTYDTNINWCWLKNGVPDPVDKYGVISGFKVCQ